MCEALAMFILLLVRRCAIAFVRWKETEEFHFDTALVCLSSPSFVFQGESENCAMKIYFYFHLGYFALLHHYSFGFCSAFVFSLCFFSFFFDEATFPAMFENNSCARNN